MIGKLYFYDFLMGIVNPVGAPFKVESADSERWVYISKPNLILKIHSFFILLKNFNLENKL